MKRVIHQARFLSFVVCCAVCIAGGSASLAAVDHAPFDAILKDVVQDERVDYAKVKANHTEALGQYLDALAAVDATALSREEQLAFYINLYNATMMKAVVDRGGPAFKPPEGDFAVFKDKLVRTRDGTFSLNELENDIIRKRFDDARIHAALNCAAVSCPPILPRAYLAADLNATLDENVRRWLNDPNRNVIDRTARKLRLSKIFDWYAPDFGGKENAAAWVAEKLGDPALAAYAVEHLEYDWTLNARR